MRFSILMAGAFLAISFGQPAIADKVVKLSEQDKLLVELAVRQELTHPQKAIFIPFNFGIETSGSSPMTWVCGHLRATDENGTYLPDQSEFIGWIDPKSGKFIVESLALTSVADRMAILDLCLQLDRGAD